MVDMRRAPSHCGDARSVVRFMACSVTLLALAGCPGHMSRATKGYAVKAKQMSAYRLDYDSPQGIDAENRKSAKLKMEKPPPSVVGKVGGRLLVHVHESTIGAANTKYVLVVVKKNGVEILREQGTSRVASVGSSNRYGTVWNNLMIVNLPVTATPPFTVYVVNEIGSRRFEYNIVSTKRRRR